MILIKIIILFTYLFNVYTFNNEDYLLLLCGADENNFAQIMKKCEHILQDAVDGCLDMTIIQLRNTRSPRLRIDEKYYQFVMCDNELSTLLMQNFGPCVQQLPTGINANENFNDWMYCLQDITRSLEDKIEHQGDPNKAFEDVGTKGISGNNGKPTTKSGNNSKNSNKGKTTNKKSNTNNRLKLRAKAK